MAQNLPALGGLVGLWLASLFWGANVVLFCLTAYKLARRTDHGVQIHRILLCLITFQLLVTTAHVFSCLADLIGAFIDNGNAASHYFRTDGRPPLIAQLILCSLNVFCGDGFLRRFGVSMFFRIVVFYSRCRWWVPWYYRADFIDALFDLSKQGLLNFGNLAVRGIEAAPLALTFAVQCSGTLFIGWRAWSTPTIVAGTRWSLWTILWVVVESGGLYSAATLTAIVVGFTATPLIDSLVAPLCQIASLVPLTIILRECWKTEHNPDVARPPPETFLIDERVILHRRSPSHDSSESVIVNVQTMTHMHADRLLCVLGDMAALLVTLAGLLGDWFVGPLWGVNVVLYVMVHFAFASSALASRSSYRRLVLYTISLQLLLSTGHASASMADVIICFSVTKESPHDYFADSGRPALLGQIILYTLNAFIGDSFIVWRVYVSWGRRLLLVVPLILLNVGATVLGLTATAELARIHTLRDARVRYMTGTAWMISLIVQGCGTLLIVWRVWSTPIVSPSVRRRWNPCTVLWVFVESGCIYSGTTLLSIALMAANSPLIDMIVAPLCHIATFVPLTIILREHCKMAVHMTQPITLGPGRTFLVDDYELEAVGRANGRTTPLDTMMIEFQRSTHERVDSQTVRLPLST
ncbi:hypothetical protein K488DRAFT_89970 [Vararia minispora EC-137]|uniref:Uncharacterized protein n=1 Tax=Vararia minispora EC-137 TaxID=1314806 RepID=A0ACB8Q8U6_9AGAM|nr:hypothetical protein K488DRAFT_89970 [Vararia minispora EC-137]